MRVKAWKVPLESWIYHEEALIIHVRTSKVHVRKEKVHEENNGNENNGLFTHKRGELGNPVLLFIFSVYRRQVFSIAPGI